MATKKQRKRRSKERRHDWEYVYVDEDGREVEVEEEGGAGGKAGAKAQSSSAKAVKSTEAGRSAKPAARGGRKVEPPSWRRVFRRALIFAPIMLVIVYLLKPKSTSTPGVVLQTMLLLAIFIPFSYLMDSIMYRSFQKRLGGGAPPKKR
jgi:hypothetical protein